MRTKESNQPSSVSHQQRQAERPEASGKAKPSPFEGGRGDDNSTLTTKNSKLSAGRQKPVILNRHHAFLLIDLLKDRIREYCDGPIEPVGEYPAGDFLIKQIEVSATPIIEPPRQAERNGAERSEVEAPSLPRMASAQTRITIPENLLTKNLGKRYKLQYLPGKSGIKFNYMGCPTIIHFNKAEVKSEKHALSKVEGAKEASRLEPARNQPAEV